MPENILSSFTGTYANGPHRVIVSFERGRLMAIANATRAASLVRISTRKFLVDNDTGCVMEFAVGDAGAIHSLNYICGGRSIAYRKVWPL